MAESKDKWYEKNKAELKNQFKSSKDHHKERKDKHCEKERPRKVDNLVVKEKLTVKGSAHFEGPTTFEECPKVPGITFDANAQNPCDKPNSVWTDGSCLNFTDKNGKTECLNPKPVIDDPIIGWWTDTFRMTGNPVLQLVRFYYDEKRNIRAKLYAGWANQYREWTPEDFIAFGFFPKNDVLVKPTVGPAGPGYIFNYIENPSVDETLLFYSRYTLRIQDDGTLYGFFLDVPTEGGRIGWFNRYYRLDDSTLLKFNPSTILPYSDPTNVDTTDPVNIFKWSVDYLLYKLAELNTTLNPNDYPGIFEAKAYAERLLNEGVVYESTISDIWRTRNPVAYFPTSAAAAALTTSFVTTGWHGVHRFGSVYIDGLKGEYEVYNSKNGPWRTSAVENQIPRNLTTVYSPKHFNSSTLKNYFNLDGDSSKFPKYDPNIHGVGRVRVVYGPVKHNTEYYELMGAIGEFYNKIVLGTHSQTITFFDNTVFPFKLPKTFSEVKAFMAKGIAALLGVPTRGRNPTRYNQFYLNSRAGRAATSGSIPANDPTGMYIGDPQFAYSINRLNYLNPAKTYSVYYGIVGPVKPNVPITGALTLYGYPNNGSEFVFATGVYGGASPAVPPGYPANFWTITSGIQEQLIGGIIDDPAILAAAGQKDPIAYIYLLSMSGADSNRLYLAVEQEFTKADPTNPQLYPATYWNFVRQFAPLMAKLQESKPKKYIIDVIGNGGGLTAIGAALLSFFGGDRPGLTDITTYADNGNKPPVSEFDMLNGKEGISIKVNDVNNILKAVTSNQANVLTNLTAKEFPELMVRGDGYQVNILTSINSFSAADLFPHFAIAGANGRDLGYGVKAKIIGEIDGRLHGGSSAFAGLYVNTSHNLLLSGQPWSGVEFIWESGAGRQRPGQAPYNYYLNNQNDLTAPDVLINGDLDSTVHLDTGYVVPYPLSTKDGGNNPNVLPLSSGKKQPLKTDNKTWRNILLEAAIIN